MINNDNMHDDHADRLGNVGPDSLPDGHLNLFEGVPNPFEDMPERIAEAPLTPDPIERERMIDALKSRRAHVLWPGDVVEDEDGTMQSVGETRRIDPDSVTVIPTE